MKTETLNPYPRGSSASPHEAWQEGFDDGRAGMVDVEVIVSALDWLDHGDTAAAEHALSAALAESQA